VPASAPASIAPSWAPVAAARRSAAKRSATSARCAVLAAFRPTYTVAAASASTRYELVVPSAIATSPPAPTTAPPMMNGPRVPRRSLHTPVASGTANPAAALTSMTAPISPGRSAMRSSSTGT
jgi:hypothetical protein